MNQQIDALCGSIGLYFHLSNTAYSRIRHLLSDRTAEQLVHAFVTSRLDNCNALFLGIPQNTTGWITAYIEHGSEDSDPHQEIWPYYPGVIQALGRLRVKVLKHKGVYLRTKIKICKAVVLTSLLCGHETWTFYRRRAGVEQFYWCPLHSIMGIQRKDKVSNQEVLGRADLPSVESMLRKAQPALRWLWHVMCIDDTRIPKQLLYDELKEDWRKQGRPRTEVYKDTMKHNLKWCNIHPHHLNAAAAKERQVRRSHVYKAFNAFEYNRQQLSAARHKRHRAAAITVQTTKRRCQTCGRVCCPPALGFRVTCAITVRETDRLVTLGHRLTASYYLFIFSLHWLPMFCPQSVAAEFQSPKRVGTWIHLRCAAWRPAYQAAWLRDAASAHVAIYTGYSTVGTGGGRALSNNGPKLWNSPSLDVRTCRSVWTFKSKLKTCLFEQNTYYNNVLEFTMWPVILSLAY